MMLIQLTADVFRFSLSTTRDRLTMVGSRVQTLPDFHQNECLTPVIDIGDVDGSVKDMVSTSLLLFKGSMLTSKPEVLGNGKVVSLEMALTISALRYKLKEANGLLLH